MYPFIAMSHARVRLPEYIFTVGRGEGWDGEGRSGAGGFQGRIPAMVGNGGSVRVKLDRGRFDWSGIEQGSFSVPAPFWVEAG